MQLITTKDIAHVLQMSRKHVQNTIITRRDFPKPIWRGRPNKYEKSEFEKWLLRQRG